MLVTGVSVLLAQLGSSGIGLSIVPDPGGRILLPPRPVWPPGHRAVLERAQDRSVGAQCCVGWGQLLVQTIFNMMCTGRKSWAGAVQAFEGQQLELGTRRSSAAQLVRQPQAAISPCCSAWVGFGELEVERGPVWLVPYPAVNSKRFLPDLFLQGKEGAWRVGMAVDREAEINDVLSA